VDTFREKEVPRQVEEIEDIVEKLSEFTESLEKAKEEAMVSVCELKSASCCMI